MLDRLTPQRRNWALAGLGVLVLWFAWTIRDVLNPLVLGYLLAFIVHPAVVRLEARGWSRRAAVNLIFAGTAVVITMFLYSVVVQGTDLVGRLSRSEVWERLDQASAQWASELEEWSPGLFDDEGEPDPDAQEQAESTDAPPDPGEELGDERSAGERLATKREALPVEPDGEQGSGWVAMLRSYFRSLTAEQAAGAGKVALQGVGGVWSRLRSWGGSLMGLGMLLVLLPMYTYFLLFELGRIHGFVRRYIPARERERVSRIGAQIGEVISSFFRGRLVVCFLKGAILTTGLVLAGVDYALLLGMGSGFLSLIPFVGPFIGFAIALLIGMTMPGGSMTVLFLKLAAVFVVAELIEGYVLVPKVLGDSLGLHPVVVLVSIFAGGAALGMFGFLIALPLTAAIVILVRELVLPALADFADESVETKEEPTRST